MRAVPWVVGAEMFTRRVLLPPYLIVSSARTACDAQDIIPSSPLLRLYRYDKKGRVLPVTSERLDAIAPEHDFQSEADEPLHEVTCRLPAGVFVFLDELRRFVDWIYPPGCYDGECRDAITLNTSPDLPDEMIERLREGFVAPRPNAASERSRPRKILFWLAQNEILIPADQVPGAIADTLYPPLERNESVGSALNDSNTVRRLEAEREQAKQLRRKFPHLKEGDKFSIGELNAYLASMGIEAEIRHRNDTSQIVSLGPEGRWAGRQFAHGFNSVRDPVLTDKRSPAVSDSRCCIIASEQELHIDHWIELTGVGVGQHESYFVANDRVAFRKWEDDFIAESPVDWQIDMHRDNRIAPSLIFPCSPQELLTFVDTAIGIHCFMVPDAFREEVHRLRAEQLAIEEAGQEVLCDQQISNSSASDAGIDYVALTKRHAQLVASGSKKATATTAKEFGVSDSYVRRIVRKQRGNNAGVFKSTLMQLNKGC